MEDMKLTRANGYRLLGGAQAAFARPRGLRGSYRLGSALGTNKAAAA